MTIKNILVHVEPGPASEFRLKYAMAMAACFDATLTGITVTLPPTAVAFAIMSDPQLYGVEMEIAAESSAAAKTQFERAVEGCNIATHWRDGNGVPADVINAEAGCMDLVILGRANRRDLNESFYSLTPADVVMTCGRPVLILPDNTNGEFCAKRIAVAWKSTPEAARAAHDAMPLLTQADAVILIEMIPATPTSGRYTIPIEAMGEHLRAHDIPVTIRRVPLESGDAGDQLVRLAAENHADLIVAGGYGHSRIREWVLGGVTRSLLQTGSLPCLLSH